MWSHCMFCHQSLGRNEAVEAFPIGRRLAFDAARGRLWVVCWRCDRWNLTPLEERWEAIEACEELFRETRMRVSTDQIGLARLREGLELVRIGAPQRPEFAAWRYGDQFGRRRKRALVVGAAGVTVVGAVAVGGMLTGAISGVIVGQFGNVYNMYQQHRTVARIRTDDGRLLKVRGAQLPYAAFLPREEGDGWDLNIRHTEGDTLFSGQEATRLAGRLMTRVNRTGGAPKTVQEAVRRIEEARHPEAYLSRVLDEHGREARFPTIGLTGKPLKKKAAKDLPGTVARMDGFTKLAVEMALHEEQERRALEGELFLLERAWAEAEEVAAIADDLLLPEAVEDRLATMKEVEGPGGSG